MASYETIPAAAAEDGLLATPKPQPSLKRLVAGAAVVSFALGAVAATASTKIQTATSFKTDTKSFFWNYDGSNEVEYDYDYNDQKNFPGAVKLWKKDGSNTGWYKVYNNCEDGIGKDGKVGCYLHFYCLDWNTDDLGSDC